jgi:GNAT superfamily N-acetyltransferase
MAVDPAVQRSAMSAEALLRSAGPGILRTPRSLSCSQGSSRRSVRSWSSREPSLRSRVSAVWLAAPDETDVVARLLVQFRDHLGHSSPSEDSFRASVTQLIERTDSEFWLGAPADGIPAQGICQLRFRHCVWTAAEDCWLEDLFVNPEARRSGLGRALVQQALDRARERGCRRVELDTDEHNDRAIRLYESLGFSATSKGTSPSVFLGARLDG